MDDVFTFWQHLIHTVVQVMDKISTYERDDKWVGLPFIAFVLRACSITWAHFPLSYQKLSRCSIDAIINHSGRGVIDIFALKPTDSVDISLFMPLPSLAQAFETGEGPAIAALP